MEKKRAAGLLAVAGLTAILAAGVIYTVLTGAESKNGQEISAAAAQAEGDGQTIITLQQNGTAVVGDGAAVAGNTVNIRQGGAYRLSGKLEEGQIFVEAGSDKTVVLVFSGVDIANSSGAAVYIENAGNTTIILEEGSENRLQSGEETEIHGKNADADGTAEGAALYARDDLTISGSGSLRVLGYINNGIHTANNLRLEGGKISVEALNHGIKGKDSITVTDGVFSIVSGGDGLKSDDTTGEGYGVVTIAGGNFSVESGEEGVQAETALELSGGDFSVDSRDDGFHSNGSVMISGGNHRISAGDDGIHADTELIVQDGNVTISLAHEGMEGNQIQILGGEITISSAEDGINAHGGWSGQESFGNTADGTPDLRIAGGTVSINADGDGLDSNGNISIEGGVITIDGPTGNWNGAIDFGSENGGDCTINGGTVLAIGSSGMADTFSEKSGQYSFRHYFDTPFAADDEITIADRQGNVLYSHTAAKSGSSAVFSCPELVGGETYILQAGEQRAEITLNAMSTLSGGQGQQNL